MARVLMSIVIVFLCCHSPKIVVNFYEALQVNGKPHLFFSHNVVVDNLQHFSVGTKGVLQTITPPPFPLPRWFSTGICSSTPPG